MPETAKPRVAVIGLGSMGFGMATSLRRAGFEVMGCDVSADTVKRFVGEGGKVAEVVVSHHPRAHGTSKYGMNRVVKVLLKAL